MTPRVNCYLSFFHLVIMLHNAHCMIIIEQCPLEVGVPLYVMLHGVIRAQLKSLLQTPDENT